MTAVPGVPQLNEAIKGRAVVVPGFQFVDKRVGETGLAAGEVVARVVGADLSQLAQAMGQGVKKAFQGIRGECRGRTWALEGKTGRTDGAVDVVAVVSHAAALSAWQASPTAQAL